MWKTIFSFISPSFLFIAPVNKKFYCLYREFDGGICQTDTSNISTKTDLDMYLSESDLVIEAREVQLMCLKTRQDVTDVIVDDMVEGLPGIVFAGCENLVSVKLPDTMKEIGVHAFNGYQSLEYVAIPDSIRVISHGEFNGCVSLTSIVLPEGLEYIGDAEFYGCSSLFYMRIPKSLQYIGENVFRACRWRVRWNVKKQ